LKESLQERQQSAITVQIQTSSTIKMSKHPFVRIEYASFATSTQVISTKQKEEILSVAVQENNHHGTLPNIILFIGPVQELLVC